MKALFWTLLGILVIAGVGAVFYFLVVPELSSDESEVFGLVRGGMSRNEFEGELFSKKFGNSIWITADENCYHRTEEDLWEQGVCDKDYNVVWYRFGPFFLQREEPNPFRVCVAYNESDRVLNANPQHCWDRQTMEQIAGKVPEHGAFILPRSMQREP